MHIPHKLQKFLSILGPALVAVLYLYIFSEHLEYWSDFSTYWYFIPSPNFFLTATAIYYLWTSPFGQLHKIPLSIALLVELFIYFF